MAKKDATTYFREMLLQFITEPDPLHAMLQWVSELLAELEAEQKGGAEKRRHATQHTMHFSEGDF